MHAQCTGGLQSRAGEDGDKSSERGGKVFLERWDTAGRPRSGGRTLLGPGEEGFVFSSRL